MCTINIDKAIRVYVFIYMSVLVVTAHFLNIFVVISHVSRVCSSDRIQKGKNIASIATLPYKIDRVK